MAKRLTAWSWREGLNWGLASSAYNILYITFFPPSQTRGHLFVIKSTKKLERCIIKRDVSHGVTWCWIYPTPQESLPNISPKASWISILDNPEKNPVSLESKGTFHTKFVQCQKSAVLVYLIKSTYTSKISNT